MGVSHQLPLALYPISSLVERSNFVTLHPPARRVREWVAWESCLSPSPPSPPHVSIADLHDHQPDIPVLCLIQLVHQLPIITLRETQIRSDFKGVPPLSHPD